MCRVVFRIPKAGYIQQFLLSKFGWVSVILIPCLGVVVYDILKIFTNDKDYLIGIGVGIDKIIRINFSDLCVNKVFDIS